jgi:hypothetical protein
MELVAGIDIGNSTTEIVISDRERPVAWDRRPTRGTKGSQASVQAAHSLLRNMEREHNLAVAKVVVAPWHPVETLTSTVHEPLPETGTIRIVKTAHNSVVGDGWAAGEPWLITTKCQLGVPVIALVPAGFGFALAAKNINEAVSSGAIVGGVIVADDEAVLIAKRINLAVPVVDGADLTSALQAIQLFVEVRPQGFSVQTATDVWALRSALNLDETQATHLNSIARWVRHDRTVVLGVFSDSHLSNNPTVGRLTWLDGTSTDLFESIATFSASKIGDITAIEILENIFTSDVWAFDITAALSDKGLRNVGHTRDIAIAQLARSVAQENINLETIFDAPVTIAKSEAQAAALGANTTPGLAKDAVILDIGGGTLDIISISEFDVTEMSAAGAGELLTAAVAHALGISRGAADWIKRGPAQRLESPHVLLGEDGSKAFVEEDKPYPATAMGSLVTPGPAGYLTFGQNVQPAEWRIMRQSLKRIAIGANVDRLLQSFNLSNHLEKIHNVVIVGGPAADDELIPILSQVQGIGGLGRGNVAGILGHRFAVAYGLSQLSD